MPDTIYCYPDTDVLINKYGILDSKKLDETERYIVRLREFEIRKTPVKGNFDFKHLQAIHKSVFGDIYDWAGEPRQINIHKGGSHFCNCAYIQTYADGIFDNIRKDNFLIGLSKETAMAKLAEYIGEINVLHPSREGNGRSQRQFIEYLAKATGFQLMFSKVYPEDIFLAAVDSFNGVYSRYEKIFNDISEPMTINEQREFINSVSKQASNVFEKLYAAGKLPERKAEHIRDKSITAKPESKPQHVIGVKKPTPRAKGGMQR